MSKAAFRKPIPSTIKPIPKRYSDRLSTEKLSGMRNVLVLNKDSADLMSSRGVDPFEVLLAFEYAIRYVEGQKT